MAKFEILVEETLATVVEVEADSSEEAVAEVERRYKNEEIVLTSEDYTGDLVIKDVETW